MGISFPFSFVFKFSFLTSLTTFQVQENIIPLIGITFETTSHVAPNNFIISSFLLETPKLLFFAVSLSTWTLVFAA